MMPGASAGPRPAPRFNPDSLVRYAPIALKLDSRASRSTRAVVQRTTTQLHHGPEVLGLGSWVFGDVRTQDARRKTSVVVRSAIAAGQIAEARLLADERELDGSG